MSASGIPMKTVLVQDNRVILDNVREYAIVKGGREIKYKNWTTTNISSNNIQWTCVPPSFKYIMDRRIKSTIPTRLALTGTVQPGQRLLNPGRDAPRAFPIHSSAKTFSITINNQTVTQTISEFIHALLCYNTTTELLSRDYSDSPSCPDRSQSYGDLYGEVANPLSMNGDANFGAVPGRGGYSGYNVVYNPINNTGAAVTITAYVDLLLTEQIMASPLYFGDYANEGSGFINVSSFDFQINFVNNPGNRMWSHADDPTISTMNDYGVIAYFRDFPQVSTYPFSYDTTLPTLHISYITPTQELLSKVGPLTNINWPYFSPIQYPTDIPAIAFGNTVNVNSQNINLGAIPRRIYVFARPTNNNYYANSTMTDSFYAINSLTVNFDNRTFLSEASREDLYYISRKNHLNLSYSDFAGLPFYKVGGNTFDNTNQYYGRGTVLCFEPSTDWGLEDDEAAGLGGQWNLYLTNVQIENINNSGAWDNFPVTLYVVAVYEGVFNIPNISSANVTLSKLTPGDIQSALMNPSNSVSYNSTQRVNGGNFYSTIKEILPSLKDINKFIKKHKVISKGLDAASYLPVPIPGYQSGARIASDLASSLGYGGQVIGGEVIGGEVIGGAQVRKQDLYKRLKRR